MNTFSVRSLTFSSIILLFAIGASAQEQKTANKTPPRRTTVPGSVSESLETHSALTYAKYAGRELQLDLFRPRQHDQALPAILCIHGGGWWQGTRKSQHSLAKTLASHGYVTVTNTYRLSGETGFPAAVHDCKAAIRWLRANAKEYGIDPDAIGVTGLSAGGHLAALLATSAEVDSLEGDGGNEEQSSRVQACYAMGAQSDFNAEHIQSVRRGMKTAPAKPNVWVQFLGGDPTEVPQRYELASPRQHLDANDPPLAFMAGELDNLATHADGTRTELKELGIASDLLIIEGAPHAFLGRQDWFDQALERCVSFFDKHLK